MKIIHVVSRSLVQFTPARIAHYWGRYFAEHAGWAVAIRRPAPCVKIKPGDVHFWQEPLGPDGFICQRQSGKRTIRDLLRQMDVIHCHDDFYPTQFEEHPWKVDLKGKILVYHAHIGSIPERYFRKNRNFHYDDRVKHVSIPNGYGRIFDVEEERACVKWGRLSDVLDLNHPTFRPSPGLRQPQVPPRLRVVYTYSNHREGGKINAKRPRGHLQLVGKIRDLNFETCSGRSIEESMGFKKSAHVVLEECYTPYIHLSALEGAAVGTMVVTNFDDYTRREVSAYLGAPEAEWPFYHVTPETLASTLEKLKLDPGMVTEWGRRGLEWMRTYYEPRRILEKYLALYRS